MNKRPLDRMESGGRGRGRGGVPLSGRGKNGRGNNGKGNNGRGKNFFKMEFVYDPWNSLVQERVRLNQVDDSERNKDFGLLSSTMCGTVKPSESSDTEALNDLVGSTVSNAGGATA